MKVGRTSLVVMMKMMQQLILLIMPVNDRNDDMEDQISFT